MIHLPDCSITETHARGLRRAEDRWVDRRQTTWTSQRHPRRYGPRVRQIHEEMLAKYGHGRVKIVPDGKKSMVWFFVDHDESNRYILCARSIERKSGTIFTGSGRMPLAATAHCYERFIQGFLRDGVDWVTLMLDSYSAISSVTDYEREPGESVFDSARWNNPGNFKVWIPQGLVMVEVPERGCILMRTVIGKDALIGPNRTVWETLAQSDVRAQRCMRPASSDWFEEMPTESASP